LIVEQREFLGASDKSYGLFYSLEERMQRFRTLGACYK
jgi:hypothetical protein